MLFAVAIFFFVLLVIVHEFGHFIAAKRNGVEVDEFGIGFPPKLTSKVMGKGFWKTEYSLNLLPLGGFVRLKGESDADTRKGSFGAASLKTKVKIMLAGVGMNLLTAVAIFIFLAFVGIPRLIPNQYLPERGATVVRSEVLAGYVIEDSPASKAGIQATDEFVKFNGQEVDNSEQLMSLIDESAGNNVEIVLEDSDDQIKTVQVQLNPESSDQPSLGISPFDLELTRYGWNAPVVGVVTTAQFTWETLKGLGGLFVDLFTADFAAAQENVAGPVGVVVILQNSAELGILYVLSLIGIISLTLAIMNALPIPALDGGRLAVTLLFRAMRKPLTEETEQKIHGTGFAVLILLILLITVVDIKRFF